MTIKGIKMKLILMDKLAMSASFRSVFQKNLYKDSDEHHVETRKKKAQWKTDKGKFGFKPKKK